DRHPSADLRPNLLFEVVRPRLVPRQAIAERGAPAERDDAQFAGALTPHDVAAIAPHVDARFVLDLAMHVHIERDERRGRDHEHTHDGNPDVEQPAPPRQPQTTRYCWRTGRNCGHEW